VTANRVPLIERYRDRLPVTARTPVVSLLEGSTPLLRAPRLERELGLEGLFLKLEGMNPTGSFKDRGMTVAVSKAMEEGARGVLCASTGNTAASAAAYAARAGIRCLVYLPKGAVALGKLTQAVMHGAEIVEVAGNFDQALRIAVDEARSCGLALVNSLNPYRLQGQKTAAFEIAEDLGRAPDWQFMPVGNAGNITAYWMGYQELSAAPRLMGFQASGAAPLVLGRPVPKPKTLASAIRIGKPASGPQALKARDESGGMIGKVSDAEILAAYRRLAATEGIFCEPSSAAGLAGLIKLRKSRRPLAGRIVVILTGHGLKDPETPMRFKARRRVLRP
jgi:threonine synthase